MKFLPLPHTCQPSPAPGLQLLLHPPPVSPCQSPQNASSQSFLSLHPASKASSQSGQNLMPPHWTAPGGLYSNVSRQWSNCGCSSDYCTIGKGQCHCSDDRCVHPLHGCTLGHICSGTSQKRSHRSGCRQQVCSNTRWGPHRLFHLAWVGSQGGRSSSNRWGCRCRAGHTCGLMGFCTHWLLNRMKREEVETRWHRYMSWEISIWFSEKDSHIRMKWYNKEKISQWTD